MTSEELSDDEIFQLVNHADAELFRAGMEVKQRQWEVPRAVMKKFGYVGYVMFAPESPPILDKIQRAFNAIYRQQDLAIGGHIGVYMYRNVFVKINVPHIFGNVKIDPFQFVEMTDLQKRIVFNVVEERESFWTNSVT